MAAFSYQQPTFLLDSAMLPNSPVKMPGLFEFGLGLGLGDINATCFPYFPPQPLPESSIDNLDTSKNVILSDNEPSMTQKQRSYSSSLVVGLESGDQVTQDETQKMDKRKKKKNGDGSCSNFAESSKDVREGKSKRQRKCSSASKDAEEDKRRADKKVGEEAPTGYIHVRARRGQATDSHSLAERVRREKISERMKMLQGLVPGCDKITGKAHMLDEIINYVRSLQSQVEFLSMKLASASPIFYDFGADLDASLPKPPVNLAPPPTTQSTQASCASEPTAFMDSTTSFSTRNNYPILDSSIAAGFLEQGQRPNADAFPQNGNLLWDVENQIRSFNHQSNFNTFCSFQ
ncbi:PREDICTED: transcription factor bHLH137-like isoform X2 [Nelumbo nucifera]|uniref:BHLH domain-containing protein n=2 Tax=Nelumbo nucifera TaxID=4432 RepID=A0A822YNL5_NELNU|nr:PREDICTED: transcription factor bHLH137-like isoform X2 [Nelumbo nucifera]DAD34117.1 TPA_asm: hypothetical protein HUJ06_004757 [Nelumbo nucifera]